MDTTGSHERSRTPLQAEVARRLSEARERLAASIAAMSPEDREPLPPDLHWEQYAAMVADDL